MWDYRKTKFFLFSHFSFRLKKWLRTGAQVPDPWEQLWDALVPATERPEAKAKVVLAREGEAVPWHLKGLILALDENVKTLQVPWRIQHESCFGRIFLRML